MTVSFISNGGLINEDLLYTESEWKQDPESMSVAYSHTLLIHIPSENKTPSTRVCVG